MRGVALAAVAVWMSTVLVACTPVSDSRVVTATSAPVTRSGPTTSTGGAATPEAHPAATTARAPTTRWIQPPTMPTGPGFATTVVHRGADHPDDLLLDPSGALLYSDVTDGTISRLGPGGASTVPPPTGAVRPCSSPCRDGRSRSPATRVSTGSPGTEAPTAWSSPTP